MLRRLFIAIDLPDPIKNQLDRICLGLSEANWSNMHQLHITLRFIGDCDHDTFLAIKENLNQVNIHHLTLRLQGLGYFPQRSNTQVIWAGLDPGCDGPGLIELKQAVNKSLVELKLKRDKSEFVPHVTLTRLTHTLPEATTVSEETP